MKISLIINVILCILLLGSLYYIRESHNEASLAKRNSLVSMDSLRQVDSTKYAKLAFQYNKIDSVLLEKDKEILSLTKLKTKVEIKKDTVYLKYNTYDSVYTFYENDRYHTISGKVKVIKDKITAFVIIDSLSIPVNLNISFVKMKDNMVEVRADVGNKYVVLNDMVSYIKVPEKPVSYDKRKFNIFGGVLIGPSYGIGGGVRYKNFYILGNMLNNGYNFGVMYGWK